MKRYQKYRLIWPLTPSQLANIDEMFSELFTDSQVATVPPTTGGTGQTTLPAHSVLLGEGVNPVGSASGAIKTVLVGQSGADPMFSGTLNLSGTIQADGTITTGTGTGIGIVLLNGGAGMARSILGQTATLTRWILYLGNPVAETGSDAGSDFQLLAGGDAGGGIDNPLVITRAAGGAIALGGTTLRPLTLTGLVTKYNNIATVKNGVPAEYATIDRRGLSANVGATTLYAVPASGGGLYRVTAYAVLTAAGSLSSTFPTVQIIFTDTDSNASVTVDATPVLGAAGLGETGTVTDNTVGLVFTGVIAMFVKPSTTIQYQTVNYGSAGTSMTYSLYIRLEAL